MGIELPSDGLGLLSRTLCASGPSSGRCFAGGLLLLPTANWTGEGVGTGEAEGSGVAGAPSGTPATTAGAAS